MGRRKANADGKPIAQVRKNRMAGVSFESAMSKFFNEYMKKHNMSGISYRLKDGKHCDQKIDLLIDSKDLGLIGCECKRITNSKKNKGKLYFSQISSLDSNNIWQFVNQHEFLKDSNRYGIMCFKFNDINKIIIVPHQIVYQKVVNGDLWITVDEIIKCGLDTSNEEVSLKLFIKNNCMTKED